MEDIDSYLTDEIICPYCGHEFSDSYEYFRDGDYSGDIQCLNEDCKKEFFCEPCYDVHYISTKKKETPNE